MTAAQDRGRAGAEAEAGPGDENAAATRERIAAAWRRLESLLEHRPGAGVVEDAPAVARWTGGTCFALESSSARQAAGLHTDMPEALGGRALGVSPGWLLRAALATCVGTRIVLGAAAGGIALQSLELEASSRSDLRGILGLADVASGQAVNPAARECRLQVRIGAAEASAEQLRELVAESDRLSPVSRALQVPPQVSVQVL